MSKSTVKVSFRGSSKGKQGVLGGNLLSRFPLGLAIVNPSSENRFPAGIERSSSGPRISGKI
eukprot:9235118-Pyramimonas_sp.AAC.1